MHPWMLDLKRGLKSLTRHEPEKALKHLKDAIKNCPVEATTELGKILFYTGVTLKKMGYHEGAIKSWIASAQTRRTPLADRHIKRFSNEYGMAKQGLEELDDWKAFYSLQLKRYCSMKRSRTLGTLAERDMLRDLIHDAWIEFKSTTVLSGKTSMQKLALFRSVLIVFPFFSVPDVNKTLRPVSSKTSRRGESCFCGSGLVWSDCCGRTFQRRPSIFGMF